MLFSIIIPVYNVEGYLRECIDSVLNQEEKDIEIILVNDGSTDSSGKICDEYQSRYSDTIRVIHKSNEGLLLTRRCGIREAKGEWFIHLDSDDYMMPGVLKCLHETINKYNPDLIIGKIAYGDNNGYGIADYSQISFTNGQIFDENNKSLLYKHFLLDGYITSMCQKVASKKIVDINTDYEKWSKVSLAEDALQSMPILWNTRKCIYIDMALIYYRSNSTSITKKKSTFSYEMNIISKLDVYEEEKKYYRIWNIADDMVSAITAAHCRALCQHLRQMMRSLTGNEMQGVRTFVDELRKRDIWNWMFKVSDKKKTGHFSRLCYIMVKTRNVTGLFLLCKCI